MTDDDKVIPLRTYAASIYCQNCGRENRVDVERGKLVAEINFECKNCGCTREQLDKYMRGHLAVNRGPSL